MYDRSWNYSGGFFSFKFRFFVGGQRLLIKVWLWNPCRMGSGRVAAQQTLDCYLISRQKWVPGPWGKQHIVTGTISQSSSALIQLNGTGNIRTLFHLRPTAVFFVSLPFDTKTGLQKCRTQRRAIALITSSFYHTMLTSINFIPS